MPGSLVAKEIRIAAVFYGGSSLAIYENGVAQELLRMVRATAPNRSVPLSGIENVYRDLAIEAGDRDWRLVRSRIEKPRIRENPEPPCDKEIPADPNFVGSPPPGQARPARFIVDVLSGTSAGGINGVFLAKALVLDRDLENLRNLWFQQADFDLLLNDRGSQQGQVESRIRLKNPPTSLLNSHRMYLELFQALRDMNPGAGVQPQSLAPRLDLFTTATDLLGLATPLRLSFQEAIERIHKFALHFSYRVSGAHPVNDFTHHDDPLLAFAARTTSSFPVAFEPMCLQDIDEVLPLAGASGRAGSKSPRWQKYFRPYIDSGSNYIQRAFADGGYLQNKPFSFAVDELLRRRSGSRVERHLIFVDPFPELRGDTDLVQSRPDAAANALDALTVLPRYQTIREEVDRVLRHNREVRRLSRLIREVESARSTAAPPDQAAWENLSFRQIQNRYGDQYAAYILLKASSVTEEIALAVTRAIGWDERSDRLLFVRAIVRAWRDCYYGAEKICRFLDDFDFSYHIRRIDFLIRKIDELAALDPGALQLASLNKPSPEQLPEWLDALDALREEAVRTGDGLDDSYRRIWSRESELREAIVGLRLTDDEMNRVLGLSDGNAAPTGPPVSDEEAIRRALVMLGCCEGERMQRIDRIARRLQELIRENSQDKYRFNKGKFSSVNQSPLVQAVLGYYDNYERFESLLFPITYGADLGEGTEIRVVRVSPADTQEFCPGRTGPKLLGTQLGAFGAFLDRSWRQNDLMWGRIDAAEQLIHSVLPENDPATVTTRQGFVHRAVFEIVKEELDANVAVKMTAGRNAGLGDQLVAQTALNNFGESVELKLDGEVAVRLAGRATKILGGLLENIAAVRQQAQPAAATVARYTRFLWSLIEVATPRTVPQLITRYWAQVLLVFEAFLIVGGTLLGKPDVQRIGWTLLAITLAARLAIELVRGWIKETLRWAVAPIVASLIAVFAVGFIEFPSFVWAHLPPQLRHLFDAGVQARFGSADDVFVTLLGAVGVISIMLSVSMASTAKRLRFSLLTDRVRPVLGNKLTNAGLAIELPEHGDIEKVVGPPGDVDRRIAAELQFADFAFIVTYLLLFTGIAVIAVHRTGLVLALALILFALATSIFDVIEDLRILRALHLLRGPKSPAWIENGVRRVSQTKWGLLAFTLFGTAYALFALRNDNPRIQGWFGAMIFISICEALAGLLTIGGAVSPRNRRFIVWGQLPLGLALLLTVSMFLLKPDLFHVLLTNGFVEVLLH